MKTSTILLPSVQFKMSFIWTFVLTILLGFASSTAFGQNPPCNGCNSSCSVSTDPNPDVSDPCNGFDVVLVLDESWSISQINGGAQAVRNAVLNFLSSVNCGNLRVAVLEFNTNAQWVFEDYKSFSNAHTAMVNHFNGNGYNPGAQTGYTNWHQALAYVRDMSSIPDLVLFWTDGLPTAMNGDKTGGGNTDQCDADGNDNGPYQNAKFEANRLKGAGAHMFVVAIGSVGNSGVNNIRGISGNDEYTSNSGSVLTSDYSRTSFDNVAEDMRNLAFSLCPSVTCESLEVCPMSENSGSIEVTMNVGGNNYSWEFDGPGSEFDKSGTNDNDPTRNFTGLGPGNYTFTLTNVGGCTVSTNCSVTIAEMLTCNATINNNIDCINTTGSVTVQGIGGNGDYRYSTNPNSGFGTTNTFTGLS